MFRKFNGFFALELPKPTLGPPELTFSLLNGTPSTTNKGVLPLRIDPTPRIETFIPAPGSPLVCTTRTPATFPWIKLSTEMFIPSLNCSDFN